MANWREWYSRRLDSVYINSYAESDYDYTIAFDLDAEKPSSLPEDYSDWVKATTKGQQYDPSGDVGSNYTKVEYPNDGGTHSIWIVYRKDFSYDANDDRGYVLIPKNQ